MTPAVETNEWEKYYYAGSVRLAMREDSDDPLYLISDHLGSTSLVLDTAGLELAKRSYLSFGETWGVSATGLPTDYTYTGQREAPEIGLHYYVARWYDSEIGHFTQPDSVVPGAGDALAWDRYAYVNYNPIKYVDPTGKTNIVPPNRNVLTDGGGEEFIIDFLYYPLVTRKPAEVTIVQINGDLTIIPNTESYLPWQIDIFPGLPEPRQESRPFQYGFSSYVEVGGGLGYLGVIGGIELGRVGDTEFLSAYGGHSFENTDFGSSIDMGVTFNFDADISDIEGYGEDYYVTFSIFGIGGSIGYSDGSFSIAYSAGARFGIGSSESYKMLIFSIQRK